MIEARSYLLPSGPVVGFSVNAVFAIFSGPSVRTSSPFPDTTVKRMKPKTIMDPKLELLILVVFLKSKRFISCLLFCVRQTV